MKDLMELSLNETRVIGSLIEKAITTPEQYPLSLNALTSACNQKSNREPVLQLSTDTVQAVVDGLIERRLVTEVSAAGSRTRKYQHRFCNTEFSELKFTPQELGIVCVLLLRGPQTPGELRTRTNRLCEFSEMLGVEVTLKRLMDRPTPLIMRLPREPGKRESRYTHLFSGEVSADSLSVEHSQPRFSASALTQPSSPSTPTPQIKDEGVDHERLETLEKKVEQLQEDLEHLTAIVNELIS